MILTSEQTFLPIETKADFEGLQGETSYRSATDFFVLAGKSWGHGLLFQELAPASVSRLSLPAWDPPPAGDSPVIALLDSGVRPHPLLPPPDAAPPFSVPLVTADLSVGRTDPEHRVKMAYAHGTFIAGMVRMQAPAARVLSVEIMGPDGRITEDALRAALETLIEYRDAGNRVDVVCMAFGEIVDDDEPRPDRLREQLARLARPETRVVAAAGNAGTEAKVYPAAFAVEIDYLESVGAGTGEPAFYSGRGDWVTTWRDGAATSIVPARPTEAPKDEPALAEDGWGRWQGTSFATARRAAELAEAAV